MTLIKFYSIINLAKINVDLNKKFTQQNNDTNVVIFSSYILFTERQSRKNIVVTRRQNFDLIRKKPIITNRPTALSSDKTWSCTAVTKQIQNFLLR